MPVAYFWSFDRLRFRSREFGTEIAAGCLMKSRSRVELKSTGSDRVVLGLRPAATLMQVSVSRHQMGTFEELRHKHGVNERPETRATSSMHGKGIKDDLNW